MGRTVGELLGSISSQELTYWAALWKVRSEEMEQARRDAEMNMPRRPRKGFGS